MKNLWANSSHIKSDRTNKTSARSWEVGLQSSGGNFSIFSLVTLQFICQVCWFAETVTCDRPLFEFCWMVIFISPLFIFNRKHLRQAAENLVVAYRVRAAKIVETTSPYPFRRDSFAFPRRSSLVLVVTARLLFYFHRWTPFFFIFLRSHLLFNEER